MKVHTKRNLSPDHIVQELDDEMLSKAKSNQSLDLSLHNEKTRLNDEDADHDLHRNESKLAKKLAGRGFEKEKLFEKKYMVPLLIFESVFFLVELLYFLFADLTEIGMIGFYGFEIGCLVLFSSVAVVLLVFFLRRDAFLISEIVLSGILVLTDVVIIVMRVAIRDEVHVFLWICLRFGRALRVTVLYFRAE